MATSNLRWDTLSVDQLAKQIIRNRHSNPPIYTPNPSRYRGGLNSTHRKILKVILNPECNAETNREIAKAIGKSQTMVDHYMLDIYKAFGVRTCRGLIRFQDEIKRVLGV